MKIEEQSKLRMKVWNQQLTRKPKNQNLVEFFKSFYALKDRIKYYFDDQNFDNLHIYYHFWRPILGHDFITEFSTRINFYIHKQKLSVEPHLSKRTLVDVM